MKPFLGPNNPLARRRRRLLVEFLEARDLLVASPWQFVDDELLVEGTSHEDRIVVVPRPAGRVAVQVNGRTSRPYRAERVVVFAGEGDDVVKVAGGVAIPLEAHGGDGNDELSGGRRDDRLFGDAGNDRLDGNGGDDQLAGGAGRDTLSGGPGNDLLRGDDGDDGLNGGAGDDDLDGGAGRDVLHGEAGEDRISGGAGDDLVYGGDDDDLLHGQAGSDRLYGGRGRDLLVGDDDADILNGQAGYDFLIGGFGADRIAGGDGDDVLVGGPTVFDPDAKELQALRADLSPSSPTETRAAATKRLTGATIYSDERDQLDGQSGGDRIYHGPEDLVRNSRAADSLTLIAAQSLGANHAVTAEAGVQQMPSVAIDPGDARHVVVAYMDRPAEDATYTKLSIATSRDGGRTWRRDALPLPTEFSQSASDPIARFDAQGRLYVLYMAATFLGPQPELPNPLRVDEATDVTERTYGFQSNNGIFLVRSDDGGDHWSEPAAVEAVRFDGARQVPFNIMPDLNVDTFVTLPDGRPNPHYGNLYATWSQYYQPGGFPGQPDSSGGSQVMFASSRDGGLTWETMLRTDPDTGIRTSILVDDFQSGQGVPPGLGAARSSRIAIGPAGDVFVSTFDLGIYWVYHSTDAGNSFVPPDPATGRGLPFGVEQSATVENPAAFPAAQFRAQYPRVIAADPTRPGRVYVAEAINQIGPSGEVPDEADIWFARSDDYGVTWRTTYRVGGLNARVLNDDNAGVPASGAREDVVSGQVLPQLVVDQDGTLALIWYDSRRNPDRPYLDVFGTVSQDGGETFSPNFRVTDRSFDPDAGQFTDATGQANFFLGDLLGLAAADGKAFAAWTDTRGGDQDVFFAEFSLRAPPAGTNDRFEPNEWPSDDAALDLGDVVTKYLPRLAIDADDQDWFRFRSVADGTLTLTATLATPDTPLILELYDADGVRRLASGEPVADVSGRVASYRVALPTEAGQGGWIRVAGATRADYSLDIVALTADLGTQVYGQVAGDLAAGANAYYLLTIAADGALDVALRRSATAPGALDVSIVDADDLSVLATGDGNQVTLDVAAGRRVLLHVFGDSTGAGPFELEFTNFDQFSATDRHTIEYDAGRGPSQTAVADFNRDGRADLAVTDTLTDTVSVLLTNPDGTLQSPRQFAIGAFSSTKPGVFLGLPTYRRDLVAADLDGDDIPDIVAVNHDSSDVSVLLGRGDGTFEPQRRFDAGGIPLALAVGDVNQDAVPDLVVAESTDRVTYSVLLGRGDGSFRPRIAAELPSGLAYDAPTIRLQDLNGDGRLDLVLNPSNAESTVILTGNGDGTFAPFSISSHSGLGLAVSDVNGDGIVDLLKAEKISDTISYSLGRGNAAFESPVVMDAGKSPLAIAAADVASLDALGRLGAPDGIPDLIVANSGLSQPVLVGPTGVHVHVGLGRDGDQFLGFAEPLAIYGGSVPQDVAVADFDSDGRLDVIVTDVDGIHVIYGARPPIVPHTTFATALDLGDVVHMVRAPQTIVPTVADAYYRFRTPVEAFPPAGDQIVDISTLVQFTGGAGLGVELLDASGGILATGERLRTIAPQGSELVLHVFGRTASDGSRGVGAYSLVIDVLPAVAAVAANALLPGPDGASAGPTTNIVLTLQGDRLDPDLAVDPAHYQVKWLGGDGASGGGDDQVIPLSAGARPVVYSPGSNIDVGSGRIYPVAVRQTLTLLFDQPLPVGSYEISISPRVQSAAWNDDEATLLVDGDAEAHGHPLSQRVGEVVVPGVRLELHDLVQAPAAVADFTDWREGTPFLSQLHDDLGAILDSILSTRGDDEATSATLNAHIQDRIVPGLAGVPDYGILVIWLDPTGFDVIDPAGDAIVFEPETDDTTVEIATGFIDLIGNLEVIVIATAGGVYDLFVNTVPPLARGGYVCADASGVFSDVLTDELRGGQFQFPLALP